MSIMPILYFQTDISSWNFQTEGWRYMTKLCVLPPNFNLPCTQTNKVDFHVYIFRKGFNDNGNDDNFSFWNDKIATHWIHFDIMEILKMKYAIEVVYFPFALTRFWETCVNLHIGHAFSWKVLLQYFEGLIGYGITNVISSYHRR